jgi:hypothetical protein
MKVGSRIDEATNVLQVVESSLVLAVPGFELGEKINVNNLLIPRKRRSNQSFQIGRKITFEYLKLSRDCNF